MRVSNSGIILEDCLISFLLLSTYIILVCTYMGNVYQLKQQVIEASLELNDLKACMFDECRLSTGNNVYQQCQPLHIKQRTEEVCVEI